MRVLVCGGRDYQDWRHIHAVMDDIHAKSPVTLIIEGGALGTDRQAMFWADKRGIANSTYAADWRAHGKAADPKLNQRMLDEGKPDLVVAFPGGRGTADMVRRARAAGVEVMEIAARIEAREIGERDDRR